jgi:hypothetical protein
MNLMPNLGQVLPLAFWGTDMANPFDQFDAQQTANPFDQFDKNAAPSAPQKSMLENVGESAKAFARSAYEAIPFRKDVEAYRHQGSTTQANYLQAIKDYGREEAQRMFYAGELTPEFAAVKKQRDVESEKSAEESPVSSIAGTVAGSLVTPMPFAKLATAKPVSEGALAALKAYGQRIAGGGAGGGAMGVVSGLGEGTTVEERLKHAGQGLMFGTGFGAGVPAIGGAIAAAAKPIYTGIIRPNIVDPIRGALMPETVALEKTAAATKQGRQISDKEFQAMQAAGEPVMVGDVSTGTQSLAKSSANVSPSARAALEEDVGARFREQGPRLQNTIESFFPDSTDYTTVIDKLKQAARAENKPAYDRAYAQGSENVMSAKIWDLAQTSPTMQKAIREAEKLGADVAAAEGRTPPVNPFTFDKQGFPVFKPNATAKDANLHFWDSVKQSLDDEVDSLYRSGAKKKGSAVADIRDQLRDELDVIVPSYETARGTAAKHFKATDAFEAGIKFSKETDPKKISEAYKVVSGMSGPEKELFSRGYASNLLGKIENVKDTDSILAKNFADASPAVRRKNLVAFGPQGAAQIEMRLQTERLLDGLRKEVFTGSSTARQLAQQGAAYTTASGLGAFIGGSDASIGTAGGALAGVALKYGKGKVDERVATSVANLLVSKDPKVLEKLTAMAAKEPKVLEVVRTLNAHIPKIAGVIGAKQELPPLTIRRGP